MKTVLKRGFGMLLAVLMVMAIIPQTKITVKASTGVEAFVTRCYKVALDREPEPEGFKMKSGNSRFFKYRDESVNDL